MTQEEFIEELKDRGYSYHESIGGIIVVTRGEGSGDAVRLKSLTILPSGVRFENQGTVHLKSLTSLPSGVRFENQGTVHLDSLKRIPPGVVFGNGKYIGLDAITGDYWFHIWEGNMEGIDSKGLLNLMIEQGIFE